MSQFSDVISEFYILLNEAENVKNYPLTLAKRLINSAQTKICMWSVKRWKDDSTLFRPPLGFLQSEVAYIALPDRTLSEDATPTVLTVSDTSDLPNTGVVWINGDFAIYTGKTSTTLTGVSGLSAPYKAGTGVVFAGQLPSNFWSATRVIYDGLVAVDPIDYRDIFNRQSRQVGIYIPTSSFNFDNDCGRVSYALAKGKYILVLGVQETGKVCVMQYDALPTAMTNDTSLVTIPDNWALDTIPYLAAAEALAVRGEPDTAMEYNTLGCSSVSAMYAYYAQQNIEKAYNQRVATYWDRIWLNI